MTLTAAIQNANACLAQRVDVPSAPLWQIGKVKYFDSSESFNLMQNTVDYLTCKAKIAMQFTDDEKEFMKELFEALWWGGQVKGYKEAAQLADHYVNGNGRPLKISSEVYSQSTIVKDVMSSMKEYIKAQAAKKLPISPLKSNDAKFLRSTFAKPLFKGSRNVYKQGYLINNGALLTEQDNARLKNADHRFYLDTLSNKLGQSAYMTKWSVNSIYDFEPFSSASYVTNIPIAKGFVLKLPDGLSHYLTKIGVASNFKYFSEWNEKWS